MFVRETKNVKTTYLHHNVLAATVFNLSFYRSNCKACQIRNWVNEKI